MPDPTHRTWQQSVSEQNPALDHFQSAVVSTASHQSLVVRSCAGSGKSTTLSLRAAALVQAGMDPERILILTFSVKSKDDLAGKIGRLLPEGKRPRVQTHHAHALSTIRRAGNAASVISASEQRKLVRKVCAE
mmetsp:Transcript_66144/g.131194  ORF Transcript_66144/g.131194 Transcript_66144/m.131194 type:complete len:133 (+) Transcript_66144:239-637(+)